MLPKVAAPGNLRAALCQYRAQTPNSCNLFFLLFWGGENDFSRAALSGLGITSIQQLFFRKFLEAVISLNEILKIPQGIFGSHLHGPGASLMPLECDPSVGNAVYFQEFTDSSASASTQVNPSSPVPQLQQIIP